MANQPAYSLFDMGATHSFITPSLAKKTRLLVSISPSSFGVKTPNGSVMVTREFLKGCPLQIRGYDINTDLIVLEMHNYEVILGMNWMTSVKAMVDYQKKEVVFDADDRS